MRGIIAGLTVPKKWLAYYMGHGIAKATAERDDSVIGMVMHGQRDISGYDLSRLESAYGRVLAG